MTARDATRRDATRRARSRARAHTTNITPPRRLIHPSHRANPPNPEHDTQNAVQPEADAKSAYMRLNFFTPAQSLGKDGAPSRLYIRRLLSDL